MGSILGFNFTKRDALSSLYKIYLYDMHLSAYVIPHFTASVDFKDMKKLSLVVMQLPEKYEENFDAYIFLVVSSPTNKSLFILLALPTLTVEDFKDSIL
jgi:hypothetical protein